MLPGETRNNADQINLLLDSAWALLGLVGFEAMSAHQICQHACVPSTTFFRYFQSKQHMIPAVCRRAMSVAVGGLRGRWESRAESAGVRLTQLFDSSRNWLLDNVTVLAGVWNATEHDRDGAVSMQFATVIEQEVVPIVVQILKDGNEEGIFDVADVQESARLVVAALQSVASANILMMSESTGQGCVASLVARRSNVVSIAIERMIGAPPGCLGRADEAGILSRIKLQIPLLSDGLPDNNGCSRAAGLCGCGGGESPGGVGGVSA